VINSSHFLFYRVVQKLHTIGDSTIGPGLLNCTGERLVYWILFIVGHVTGDTFANATDIPNYLCTRFHWHNRQTCDSIGTVHHYILQSSCRTEMFKWIGWRGHLGHQNSCLLTSSWEGGLLKLAINAERGRSLPLCMPRSASVCKEVLNPPLCI